MLFQYQYYGGSGILQNVLQALNNWGFVDAFLPFVLIFTLLYIIVKRSGKGNILASHAGILSLTLTLLVIIPHVLRLYPPGQDPIVVLNQVLPQLMILLLAILMMIILMGLLGTTIPNIVYIFVSFIALLLLILAVVSAVFPAFAPTWLASVFSDPNFIALIIILVTMGLVVYFVTSGSGAATGTGQQAPATQGVVESIKKVSEALKEIMGL